MCFHRVTRWSMPALIFTAVSALSACSSSSPAAPQQLPRPTTEHAPPPFVGMPNPASVFCKQQGGESQMERSPQGVRGLCVFPDGRKVDEWEYFRANAPQRPGA